MLTGIGSFGSLYSIKEILSDYANPVLVQSIDGVGTKTIIARKMKKFNTIGIDLLSACANDILVMGAKPLTFLDYIANDKLNPIIVDKIVEGMAKACKETGVSLVGGETCKDQKLVVNDAINMEVAEMKSLWTNGLREKIK